MGKQRNVDENAPLEATALHLIETQVLCFRQAAHGSYRMEKRRAYRQGQRHREASLEPLDAPTPIPVNEFASGPESDLDQKAARASPGRCSTSVRDDLLVVQRLQDVLKTCDKTIRSKD